MIINFVCVFAFLLSGGTVRPIFDKVNSFIMVSFPFSAVFQDVHIMLFVGFPFLMAFLKRHGFSSSGFTLIVGAVIIQWGMLVTGLISNAANGVDNPTKVKIGVKRYRLNT